MRLRRHAVVQAAWFLLACFGLGAAAGIVAGLLREISRSASDWREL